MNNIFQRLTNECEIMNSKLEIPQSKMKLQVEINFYYSKNPKK